jgi:hypothetical protein
VVAIRDIAPTTIVVKEFKSPARCSSVGGGARRGQRLRSRAGERVSSPMAGSYSRLGIYPPPCLMLMPKHLNFSRPVRPVGAPEDPKRLVLARNAFRRSAIDTFRFTAATTAFAPGAFPHASSNFSHRGKGNALYSPFRRFGDLSYLRVSVFPYAIYVSSARALRHTATNNQPIPLLHDPPLDISISRLRTIGSSTLPINCYGRYSTP